MKDLLHNAEPVSLRTVTLTLCDLCLRGVGGECHVPGCALWMKAAPDVPVTDYVLSTMELAA